MNIEISKERMLEMAKKLASMDFCLEQRVFYKNILRMVKADAKGRLLDAEDNAEIYSIIRRKKKRWLKRLEG